MPSETLIWMRPSSCDRAFRKKNGQKFVTFLLNYFQVRTSAEKSLSSGLKRKGKSSEYVTFRILMCSSPTARGSTYCSAVYGLDKKKCSKSYTRNFFPGSSTLRAKRSRVGMSGRSVSKRWNE